MKTYTLLLLSILVSLSSCRKDPEDELSPDIFFTEKSTLSPWRETGSVLTGAIYDFATEDNLALAGYRQEFRPVFPNYTADSIGYFGFTRVTNLEKKATHAGTLNEPVPESAHPGWFVYTVQSGDRAGHTSRELHRYIFLDRDTELTGALTQVEFSNDSVNIAGEVAHPDSITQLFMVLTREDQFQSVREITVPATAQIDLDTLSGTLTTAFEKPYALTVVAGSRAFGHKIVGTVIRE